MIGHSAPPDPRDAYFAVSHLSADLGARSASAARVVIGHAAIKLALALGTTAVLARLVSPEEYGLLAMALPIILTAAVLSEGGLAHVLTRRREVRHDFASALFWLNVALGALACGLIPYIADGVARAYDAPDIAFVLKALAPYALLTALVTPFTGQLRRQLRAKEIERATTLATIASGGIAIALAIAGWGVGALIAQLLLVQALSLLFLVHASAWRPSAPAPAHIAKARAALLEGGTLAAERITGDLSRHVQLSLMGAAFGPMVAGLYYRADVLAQMPQRRLLSPLSTAFIPALARLQDSPALLCETVLRQIRTANLLVIPLGAALTALSDLIVRILLGPDWAAAVPILSVLGALVAGSALLSILSWTLIATGEARALFLVRLAQSGGVIAALVCALASGASMLAATAIFVFAHVGLGLVFLSLALLRTDAMSLADLVKCIAESLMLAIPLFAAVLWLRDSLDLVPWREGVICLSALVVLTAVSAMCRVASRAGLVAFLLSKQKEAS